MHSHITILRFTQKVLFTGNGKKKKSQSQCKAATPAVRLGLKGRQTPWVKHRQTPHVSWAHS